jgi:hypothetical protein
MTGVVPKRAGARAGFRPIVRSAPIHARAALQTRQASANCSPQVAETRAGLSPARTSQASRNLLIRLLGAIDPNADDAARRNAARANRHSGPAAPFRTAVNGVASARGRSVSFGTRMGCFTCGKCPFPRVWRRVERKLATLSGRSGGQWCLAVGCVLWESPGNSVTMPSSVCVWRARSKSAGIKRY